MITAKNYAAQAEASLRRISALNSGRFEISSKNALYLAETIKNSQHFAIPDNGKLFDDELKGLDLSNIRLPFPRITVEWFVSKPLGDGKHPVPKRILIASENLDVGVIFCCGAFALPNGEWGFNPFSLIIKMDNDVPFDRPNGEFYHVLFKFADGREMEIIPSYTQDNFYRAVEDGTITEQECFDVLQDSTSELMGLFEFLEALSCKNVMTEPMEKIDHAKNIRRIRDGKLPIYETKILTINTGYNSGEKHDCGIGAGTGKSVRQHLRRGHIRRHQTAGNIWVNSCVVGSSDLGVIDKSYEVN